MFFESSTELSNTRSDNRKKTKVFRVRKISQSQTQEVTIERKLKSSQLEKYPKLNLTLTWTKIESPRSYNRKKTNWKFQFQPKIYSKDGRNQMFFVHLINISSIENEIKKV